MVLRSTAIHGATRARITPHAAGCGLGVAAVVGGDVGGGGVGAVAHGLADLVEVLNRDQAALALERVAGFVPVVVGLAADNVQEVAGGEGEVDVGFAGGVVVIQRFDYLCTHCD